jgi:RND family efflux transporter MFP subunit
MKVRNRIMTRPASRFSRGITLSMVTLSLAACGGGDAPGAIPRTETPLAVTVVTASYGEGTERHLAHIESDDVAALATRTSGIIRRIAVDVGSRVRAGDLLVELDQADVEARIAAARAQANLARTGFRRVENLARDGAASRAELDQAEAALSAAEAALAEAEAQTAYVTIRAPFDGVITERRASAGDLAAPGHPILVLAAPGARKVVAELPESLAGRITVGLTLPLQVEGAGLASVRLTRVVPSLEGQGRTFRVEGVLEGRDAGGADADALARVIPGTLARILVPSGAGARLWIPEDALVIRGQLTGVYAVEDGRARLRWIRVGQRVGGEVELLAAPGAAAGGAGGALLQVIRHPTGELFDGRPVTVSATVSATVNATVNAPVTTPEPATTGEVTP